MPSQEYIVIHFSVELISADIAIIVVIGIVDIVVDSEGISGVSDEFSL